MKLTGLARELFEKWYYEKMIYSKWWSEDSFYSLPLSMQWGVVQDFADSLGYDMIAESTTEQDKYWFTIYTLPESIIEEKMFETRKEARNAAIEKLNYLINEQ